MGYLLMALFGLDKGRGMTQWKPIPVVGQYHKFAMKMTAVSNTFSWKLEEKVENMRHE